MSKPLDAITAKLKSLSPEALAELEREVNAATAGMKWIPSPGPQTEGYRTKASILLFGGSGGGGKTDLLLGLAFNEHQRSLIMRRQYTDMGAITERAIKINGTRRGYSGSPPMSLRVGKRLIEFGAARDVGDEQHWQGQPHDLLCVGRGTPILMADGAYIPIQDVVVGDKVQTLEGPRRVNRVFPVQRKRAVRVTLPDGASQIQSEVHELLGRDGWVSYGMSCGLHQPAISASTRCSTSRTVGRRSALTCAPSPTLLVDLFGRLERIVSLWLSLLPWERGRERDSFAGAALQGPGSCFVEFDGTFPRMLPRQESSDLPKQPRLAQALALTSLAPRSSAECVTTDGLRMSLLGGSTGRCSMGFHRCDERTRAFSNLWKRREVAPLILHRSTDAARPNPTDSPDGEWASIRGCSDRKRGYLHPYAKDERSASELVVSSSFTVSDAGVQDLYDIEVDELNHYISKGGFVNKNCVDEAAQFAESQMAFLMGWLRSDDPKQRCRVVFATNPPLSEEGAWLIRWFAPWLDPDDPNPALPGELRYYLIDEEGNHVPKDRPGPYEIIDSRGKVENVNALSRTFSPSSVDDNPFYGQEYKAVLNALPPHLRSALRDGNFMAARRDHEQQLIPSEWILAAQSRWRELMGRPPMNVPMCAMGVDPSGGLTDPMCIATRYDGWFGKIVEIPAKEVKDRPGQQGAAKVVEHRRDNASVKVDAGGGYGSSMIEHLELNNIEVARHLGSGSPTGTTKQGHLLFSNMRAQVYYRLREALDPSQPGGSRIMLPPDPVLMSDLCAIRLQESENQKTIALEPKEKLVKRLGRSTNRGDAVVLCWAIGPTVATHFKQWQSMTRRHPAVNHGHERQRRGRGH